MDAGANRQCSDFARLTDAFDCNNDLARNYCAASLQWIVNTFSAIELPALD
jgi:hypothetical protein